MDKSFKHPLWIKFKKSRQLTVLMLLPLIYLLIFKYYPMLGAQIAFKKYIITKGIWESPWVGLKHFHRFFTSYQFARVIKNTLGLSFFQLAAGFPAPIILALSLNYVSNERYKKTVQLVTYAPHFISLVIMVGMMMQFMSLRTGIFNMARSSLGMEQIDFMAIPQLFKTIFVLSGIWQGTGWGSIVYLAALAGIDPSQHEAAIVDGATKMQRLINIDIPGIMPTAIILLILNTGRIMNVGFQKVLLMQNPLNLRTSEVIETYVYKVGLASDTLNYSYPTAIGLFNSFVGLLLIITVNQISRKVSESSLW